MALEEKIAGLAAQLPAWIPFVSFFAPFVGGEAAVLVLAFMAGQDIFPLWSVIIGSFFGMLALDAFWFMVPRSPWAERFKQRARVSGKYRTLESRIEALSHDNDIVILFVSKVLIGTRILVLAYLSVRSISFERFIAYDSVATFLWAVVLGYTGWFAGLGYYSLSGAEHALAGILYAASIAAAFYAALWLIRRWITKT